MIRGTGLPGCQGRLPLKEVYYLEDKQECRGRGDTRSSCQRPLAEGQELRRGQWDWQGDWEEGKADSEAGGQTIPDLLPHVRDIGLHLKSVVNPFRRSLPSWCSWSGLVLETQSVLCFEKIFWASLWRTNWIGPKWMGETQCYDCTSQGKRDGSWV